MIFKIYLLLLCLTLFTLLLHGKPTGVKEEEEEEDSWTNDLHYKQYLLQVMGELEKDEDFQRRVKEMANDSKAEQVALQLQFVKHNIRTQLDEIKRKEIERLNELETQKDKLLHPDKDRLTDKGHLDHENPHTFEAADLEKLIKKILLDLTKVDKQQEDEFKRYEMEKEFKHRIELEKINDTAQRKAAEKEWEEKQTRHEKHEKIHHPGSEEQLKEVWEKEDHLEPETFDPKTFFKIHDTNEDGYLDESEMEALMQTELDKVYDPNNPDDDLNERYHEMMRMRQELMREVDKDKDARLSLNEVIDWSKSREYKEDSGWATSEEKMHHQNDSEWKKKHEEELRADLHPEPLFDEAEFEKFQEEYRKAHPELHIPSAAHEDSALKDHKATETQGAEH